eukprot:TRINITY_DN3705_c0_g1_i4.p1 TRINITY_DN3705_c0_g1~~TRINITY_DN3705_c0_g1_i4.p1  ORF type:complete len:369 (+),score=81.54 TRINITY_DN3705_c0_g1_i4:80-1186(+)
MHLDARVFVSLLLVSCLSFCEATKTLNKLDYALRQVEDAPTSSDTSSSSAGGLDGRQIGEIVGIVVACVVGCCLITACFTWRIVKNLRARSSMKQAMRISKANDDNEPEYNDYARHDSPIASPRRKVSDVKSGWDADDKNDLFKALDFDDDDDKDKKRASFKPFKNDEEAIELDDLNSSNPLQGLVESPRKNTLKTPREKSSSSSDSDSDKHMNESPKESPKLSARGNKPESPHHQKQETPREKNKEKETPREKNKGKETPREKNKEKETPREKNRGNETPRQKTPRVEDKQYAFWTESHGEFTPTIEMKIIGFVGKTLGFFEDKAAEQSRELERLRKQEEHRKSLSMKNQEHRIRKSQGQFDDDDYV